MPSERSSKTGALIMAVTLGVLLLLVVFFLWDSLTATPIAAATTLMVAVGAFIVVVMVMVYEFATMRERATHLALHLAKDRVQYSHDIFSILFRNSSVPFIVVDEHGVIESTNPSAARLFHVELDSLDGLEVFHFIAAEDETKTALIPEYFTHGKIVNDVEVVLHRPDGVDRYVLLSVFSFKDAKGKGKGLVTLIDVTKQKMVDKAKTEFVSLASHQLRTPISGMKWNIELLLTAGRENLTPAQSGYVDKIAHGLERMDMLVGDFLSVSKFELGTLSAQYTSFSAAQFLRTIYDEHDPLAKKKNVSLEPNLGKADGTISCDSHLLHMIVSNLVSNAVKYTPEGGRVKFDAVLDPAHLTVTVADTGMGIPASEQDMLFSKLFRASNAKTQVTDGTGLGLYIVREAVKILKGDISFVSTEGVGTTFTVVLPK